MAYPLRNTLLAVSHEQVRDLFDDWVVSVLDMCVFWDRQHRQLKLQTWDLRRCGRRLEAQECSVKHTASFHRRCACRVGARPLGRYVWLCLVVRVCLDRFLHHLGQLILRRLITFDNLQ